MLFRWLKLYIIKAKEAKDMAVIYVALILKGKRTLGQVPEAIREQVRQLLIDLELADLAGE